MGEGVRLIDANALKAKIEAAGEDGTIANYCRKVMADCLDNDAPTVEAIPIEWMRAHLNAGYFGAGLELLFEAWKLEQEAKSGV